MENCKDLISDEQAEAIADKLFEKKNKIILKIPFKTPTINHLYWHKGNMKIMKTEAKKIREKIKEICSKSVGSLDLFENGLKVNVEIHENWNTKEGKVKRKDILNREKFLIDSVFGALEIDDKYIFEHTMKKIQDTKEFAVIKIEKLKKVKKKKSKFPKFPKFYGRSY